MILITKVIRATMFGVRFDSFATYDEGDDIVDLPTRHWLDYDIVALAFLIISMTILELLVLGILGLLA
jgi:hypothetical protein